MHRHAHWTFVWEDGFHDVTPAGSPNFESSGDPVSAPKTFPVTFTEAGTSVSDPLQPFD